MDTKRMVLYGALFFIVMLLWTEWNKEHTTVTAAAPQAQDSVEQTIPTLTQDNEVIEVNHTLVAKPRIPDERIISIRTDLFNVKLDKKDGHIVQADLLKFSDSLDEPSMPVNLFNFKTDTLYQAQIGIMGETKNRLFTSEHDHYQLGHQDELAVHLFWSSEDGLKIERIYRFQRDQYQIEIETRVHNQSSQPWSGQLYYQLLRKEPLDEGGSWGMSSYVGASISNPANKRYEKISFKDIRKRDLHKSVKQGWVAMQQHYFLSAFIPVEPAANQFFSQHYAGDLYAIGVASPKLSLQPEQSGHTTVRLFVGPKDAEQLEMAAPGLDLTIDYGWLWFISVGLFWLLKHLYEYLGNWGWAIISVTLLIKMAFYHLSASSYRAMARLRKFQPKIDALKERHGDDRQKFSQAMMELYRKEKINPLSGCLPMIIQIPVFIALYWVLLASVELRQAPFIGWIQDLSAKDPFYVLPILMGLSMVLQQRMTPAPPDPVQAKMMMVLPVVFTFLFLNFPSGLAIRAPSDNTSSTTASMTTGLP